MFELIDSEKADPQTLSRQLGTHTLVEFIHCDARILSLAEKLEPIMLEAVRVCGATYVSHHLKQFDPIGASGVVLIAESHLSFHTWPEHAFMAFDLFTCNSAMSADAAVAFLAEQVEASEVRKQILKRGY